MNTQKWQEFLKTIQLLSFQLEILERFVQIFGIPDPKNPMVVIVGSEIIPSRDIPSLDFFYAKFPNLLRHATELAGKKPKLVPPEGVLYVRQKARHLCFQILTRKFGKVRNSNEKLRICKSAHFFGICYLFGGGNDA